MTSYGNPEAEDMDPFSCAQCDLGHEHEHCVVCDLVFDAGDEILTTADFDRVHKSCERYLR